MQSGTVFGRIGKVDFFGITVPGFYAVLAVTVAVMAVTNITTSDALAGTLDHWWVPVLVLFTSYLLGSIPRAFAVSVTDGLCVHLRRRASDRDSWPGCLLSETFPYCRTLRLTLDNMVKQKAVPREWKHFPVPDPDLRGLPAIFDYWKTAVCMRAHDNFVVIESLEARVRFFVGVFWASCIGSIFGLGGTVWTFIRWGVGSPWLVPVLLLTVVSLVLGFVFGRRLRFVRGEEAERVFLTYLLVYFGGMVGAPQLEQPPTAQA